MTGDVRYFKVVRSTTDFEGGRYKGAQPLVAAKKAARKVLGERKGPVTFTIRETTKSVPTSKRGVFTYQASKVALARPHKLKRDNWEVTDKNGRIVESTHRIKIKAITREGGQYGGADDNDEYYDDD